MGGTDLLGSPARVRASTDCDNNSTCNKDAYDQAWIGIDQIGRIEVLLKDVGHDDPSPAEGYKDGQKRRRPAGD